MISRRAQLEERERAYLALLCQSVLNEALRVELEVFLSRHCWQSHDHRAVFEAMAGWRAAADVIRAGLPARLTLLGFPDTDIDEYFAPPGVSIETALEKGTYSRKRCPLHRPRSQETLPSRQRWALRLHS